MENLAVWILQNAQTSNVIIFAGAAFALLAVLTGIWLRLADLQIISELKEAYAVVGEHKPSTSLNELTAQIMTLPSLSSPWQDYTSQVREELKGEKRLLLSIKEPERYFNFSSTQARSNRRVAWICANFVFLGLLLCFGLQVLSEATSDLAVVPGGAGPIGLLAILSPIAAGLMAVWSLIVLRYFGSEQINRYLQLFNGAIRRRIGRAHVEVDSVKFLQSLGSEIVARSEKLNDAQLASREESERLIRHMVRQIKSTMIQIGNTQNQALFEMTSKVENRISKLTEAIGHEVSRALASTHRAIGSVHEDFAKSHHAMVQTFSQRCLQDGDKLVHQWQQAAHQATKLVVEPASRLATYIERLDAERQKSESRWLQVIDRQAHHLDSLNRAQKSLTALVEPVVKSVAQMQTLASEQRADIAASGNMIAAISTNIERMREHHRLLAEASEKLASNDKRLEQLIAAVGGELRGCTASLKDSAGQFDDHIVSSLTSLAGAVSGLNQLVRMRTRPEQSSSSTSLERI